MKIILQENVENLGSAGDIVNVKEGYLRNFLLPRKLALPADEKNLKALGHQKRMVEAKKQKAKRSAESLKIQIEKIDCTIVENHSSVAIFGNSIQFMRHNQNRYIPLAQFVHLLMALLLKKHIPDR